jgi:hypothetical protein
MSAPHTPGPWLFTAEMYGLDNMRVFGVNDATGNGVANCGHDGRGQCEANARLIAAAPDLLAALQELLALHIAHHNAIEHAAARAAIRKATGAA